ncbi:hypothetical protein FD04_GL000452 [Secundilactobacillus odoratitofui DSM 19909 = JCM 15043]|uniref:Uncharacterized protein n=1 Tax=Secundilactobacillus odoratitofui DSM 19909 = JCM 15043 TaxID=1423776 RepID=A0A0R1LSA1_9LACO|nr:hypothetical protein [Secundilactobacillus odoratitofui]KRK98716.1 hypothetical protein FD04_GL000452 [Secundilactobacillus odoratitofui DSM 19909 = JCM 15043]
MNLDDTKLYTSVTSMITATQNQLEQTRKSFWDAGTASSDDVMIAKEQAEAAVANLHTLRALYDEEVFCDRGEVAFHNLINDDEFQFKSIRLIEEGTRRLYLISFTYIGSFTYLYDHNPIFRFPIFEQSGKPVNVYGLLNSTHGYLAVNVSFPDNIRLIRTADMALDLAKLAESKAV